LYSELHVVATSLCRVHTTRSGRAFSVAAPGSETDYQGLRQLHSTVDTSIQHKLKMFLFNVSTQ